MENVIKLVEVAEGGVGCWPMLPTPPSGVVRIPTLPLCEPLAEKGRDRLIFKY